VHPLRIDTDSDQVQLRPSLATQAGRCERLRVRASRMIAADGTSTRLPRAWTRIDGDHHNTADILFTADPMRALPRAQPAQPVAGLDPTACSSSARRAVQ
jgi:hypothetical protein